MYQQTIAAPVTFNGVGVHSGSAVCLTLEPASADTGVVFRRRLDDGSVREIAALSANTPRMDLSTVVGDPSGIHVATIEHLMAALYAMGIDNVVVGVDGAETPIMKPHAL